MPRRLRRIAARPTCVAAAVLAFVLSVTAGCETCPTCPKHTEPARVGVPTSH
jgi:hypothetical protein